MGLRTTELTNTPFCLNRISTTFVLLFFYPPINPFCRFFLKICPLQTYRLTNQIKENSQHSQKQWRDGYFELWQAESLHASRCVCVCVWGGLHPGQVRTRQAENPLQTQGGNSCWQKDWRWDPVKQSLLLFPAQTELTHQHPNRPPPQKKLSSFCQRSARQQI